MRWSIEVLSPRTPAPGDPPPPSQLLVVEARSWQTALQEARAHEPGAGPISRLSIELLAEGYRATDPASKVRYLIRKVPDETPLRSSLAPTAPLVDAAAVDPAIPSPPAEPAPAPAPAAPVASPVSLAPVPPPPSLAPAQALPPLSRPPPADPDALPSFEVIMAREEQPSAKSPLTYREVVYCVPPGTSEAAAENLLRKLWAELVQQLWASPPGKFINLAAFDISFSGRPPRPPLVTLTWKDWRGPNPEIAFPLRQRASQAPPPMSGTSIHPVSLPPSTLPGLPASRSPEATPAAPASSSLPETLPSSPVPEAVSSLTLPAPPDDLFTPGLPGPAPPVPAPVVLDMAPAPSAEPKSPSAAPESPSLPPTEALLAPVPSTENAPAAPSNPTPTPVPVVEPLPVRTQPADAGLSGAQPTEPPPPVPATDAQPAEAQPAEPQPTEAIGAVLAEAPPVEVKPTEPRPVEEKATEAQVPGSSPAGSPEVPYDQPAPEAAPAGDPASASPEGEAPAGGTSETVSTTSEAPGPAPAVPGGKEETVAPTLVTADPFATPSAAAGPALDARGKEVKLTKRLSGDDLLSDLFEAMHDVHFQPGLLEGVHFVLWLAVEKMPCRVAICHLFDINRREFVVAHALGERRADLLLKRVSEREPLLQQVLRRRRAVVMNAGDPLLAGERWGAIGQQVQSAVSAPVVLGGRFLGVLELVNPMDGKPFSEGDGYALAYMGEQFAEFLGQRGLLLDPEAILAFKPPRL